MIYIILGVVAYILFALYDINSVIFRNKLLSWSFFAGTILLAAATAAVIAACGQRIVWDPFRTGICGAIAAVFLILLIYTLFFALPFKATYLKAEAPPKVIRSGVYALCRHPGVLWLIGFYLFMGLALSVPLIYMAAAIFSGMDILYVVLQDRWTFMKSFSDYGDYKKDTPFLIPNLKSMKRCIQTLRWKDGTLA